ncbi:MAG TPA: YihY/virulence factor BrkB family protein [Terriglobales bacterium]|nr:YihY/virulence factor BrkB family protein [Terriglobales bacterium]
MQTSASSPAPQSVPVPESYAHKLVLGPWKRMILQRGLPTLRYLTRTEAHTFAFSVAANAILSFFPFMVLMMWLVRNVLHSQSMFDVIGQLLRDHLPSNQDFVVNSLTKLVLGRKRVKLASVLILLITSTGVFLPLEVAFNRIWGFRKNRSYLGNQIISLLLAFGCGVLAMASAALAAGNQVMLRAMMLGHSQNIVFQLLTSIALKIFALIASVGIFFLLYWLLPHGKVAARDVLPAAVAMGLLWEIGKYIYIKALPLLNFPEVYGPFSISVTLMFWAFISGLMVLAGAHLAAKDPVEEPRSRPEDEDLIEFS